MTVGIETPGVERQDTVGCGPVVQRELNSLGSVAVHRDNFVSAGLLDVDGVVCPFSVLFPAEVELLPFRYDGAGMIEIRKLLDVRDIGSLVLAKVTYGDGYALLAMPGGIVQLSAAVVDLVGVVIGDSFATEVIECGFEPAGDRLSARRVRGITERFALVVFANLTFHAAGENKEHGYGMQTRELQSIPSESLQEIQEIWIPPNHTLGQCSPSMRTVRPRRNIVDPV